MSGKGLFEHFIIAEGFLLLYDQESPEILVPKIFSYFGDQLNKEKKDAVEYCIVNEKKIRELGVGGYDEWFK